jgi:hypothetical protein
MDEDLLRSLVREAVARHLGRAPDLPLVAPLPRHASHQLLPLPPATDDGSCVIEPSVRCTHCNYCKSYGH